MHGTVADRIRCRMQAPLKEITGVHFTPVLAEHYLGALPFLLDNFTMAQWVILCPRLLLVKWDGHWLLLPMASGLVGKRV
jgi:hypothetical protein